MTQIRFIGGPLDKTTREVAIDPSHPPIKLRYNYVTESSIQPQEGLHAHVEKVRHVCLYKLHDNWPIRYKMESLPTLVPKRTREDDDLDG